MKQNSMSEKGCLRMAESSLSSSRFPEIRDELGLLAELVPLERVRLIELGCGDARLARDLVQRFPGTQVVGLEVDERQHARNIASPQESLTFMQGAAQTIPFPSGEFDGALMLKSLHHVPLPVMNQALGEIERVLRPGGWLYVSEPMFEGALNELIRVFNDEQVVRAAAQTAVNAAIATGRWVRVAERRFETPVHFASFAEFERRMMYPTFADHHIDDSKTTTVRKLFEAHAGADGAHFTRPMHVQLLRRIP